MSQQPSDLRLYQVLQQKDPSLAVQLDRIKERGLEDWMSLLTPDMGSHAGYPHFRNVERTADRIVPGPLKNDFTAAELFLLLSAIYLHDIGRVFPSAEESPCGLKPGDRCKCYKGKKVKPRAATRFDREKHAACSKPQWDHHRHSARIIEAHGASLGLPDERMAQYCALLALCHGLAYPPNVDPPYFPQPKPNTECEYLKEKRQSNFRDTSLAPYGTIRIPLLAAILRVADETDNSWTRAVRECWDNRPELQSKDLGKAFRRYVEDVEFCHEGECLVVHVSGLVEADLSSDSQLLDSAVRSINNARADMSAVIEGKWGQILRRHGITFTAVYIEHDGSIYKEANMKSRGTGFQFNSLADVVGTERGSSLKALFEAATRLALGGYGYTSYSWESLEAEVGWPLTGPDRWLALRMAGVADCFRIQAHPDGSGLLIQLEDRQAIPAIREALLGEAAKAPVAKKRKGGREKCDEGGCRLRDRCQRAAR